MVKGRKYGGFQNDLSLQLLKKYVIIELLPLKNKWLTTRFSHY